ncbi:plasmid replication protein RepC [Akkermansiaceae bacterium]|nr:plasmid replication protein RepC [Akkermansiaceae bacterium]MDB4465199.1 plasmid replication protein RepC [Akkermansiaceae bacterium]MDF1714414.1 plasmid replication protein RepC [Akkermansiaceae bacterium]
MQQLSTINHRQNAGGRTSSQELRTSLKMDQNGEGLESKVDRYHLLKLVERVGKGAGFTPRMVDLLSYYLRFTRESDWEEGSRPIVYQSLSKTALDFGISERQIQKLEAALFEVGALTWRDSGNHRRYGQRCSKSGKLLYAFGVDLTPLADLEERLVTLLEEKENHARLWMETKRQISFYRRQVKSLVAEAAEVASVSLEQVTILEEGYQAIAVQIRTHLSLPRLEELLLAHRELFQKAKTLLEGSSASPACEKAKEDSPMSEEKFAHYNDTNQLPSNKFDTGRAAPNCLARGRKGRDRNPNRDQRLEESPQAQRRVGGVNSTSAQVQPSRSSEMGPLNLKKIINASSNRFREYLPLNSREVNEHHLVDAADHMRGILQISKGSWSRACREMGRVGAAICLMLTDQATLREFNPARVPGAYFNAMVNRSKSGELNLTPAIYAILKRGGETACSV